MRSLALAVYTLTQDPYFLPRGKWESETAARAIIATRLSALSE